MVFSLALIKAIKPDLYDNAIKGKASIEMIDEFYGINKSMLDRDNQVRNDYDNTAYIIHGLWQFVISGGASSPHETEQFSKSFDSFGVSEPRKIIANIERDFFGLFELAE